MKQDTHPKDFDPQFVKKRLAQMAEGLTDAIDSEVARRQREGLPIHVGENGTVVDLQDTDS